MWAPHRSQASQPRRRQLSAAALLWSATCLRDRSTAVLRCRDEGRWQRGQTGNWSLGKQSGGEFTSAISTKRTCNDPLQAHANLAEIRCCPRFHSQPFQSRPKPLPTRSLQGQPHHRTRRVARPLCVIKGQGYWPSRDEFAFVLTAPQQGLDVGL